MCRILEVTESLACGGRENFAINILRNINHDKFDVDFFTISKEEEFFSAEVRGYNSIIHSSNTGKVGEGILNFIKKNIELAKIASKYQVIHIHGDTHLDYFKVILIRLVCSSKIIMHAHGANELSSKFKRMLGKICRIIGSKIPDSNLACSYEAAKYMYKKCKFDIIRNPIEIKNFVYNSEIRKKLRNDLKIEDDTLVIGHIGRFSPEKNHEFIINTFKELHNKNKKTKLLLIGEGELKKNIENQIEKEKLNGDVIMLSAQKDVYKYYNCFDVFWFPSIKESLGMTAIEAQITGVPVLISEGIPEEVIINKSNVIKLEYDSQLWIKETLDLKRLDKINKDDFSEFDLNKVMNKIVKLYGGESEANNQ